jgi:hypothetical protein
MGVDSQELPFGRVRRCFALAPNFHYGLFYRTKKGLYKRLAGKPRLIQGMRLFDDDDDHRAQT